MSSGNAQRWLSERLSELGQMAVFVRLVFRTYFKTQGNGPALFEQLVLVTFRSIPTVIFAGLFVGAILVLQFNTLLVRYDAQAFLGGLNTSAVIREVGPLIISFLLAGKVGAYTAAELGTLRVTEQIDAIRCLGTDPVRYLIVPRFLAIILASLILLTLALLVGILGSMAVANALCGINPLRYAVTIPRFLTPWIFLASLLKCGLYGFVVATVSCFQGYTAKNGARGVGKAVTQAAVATNLLIILAQFIASPILGRLAEALK